MSRIAMLFAAVVAVGCAHRPVEYRGNVRVKSAQLVVVNPDVKTVADADQPLFFARGSYWLFHDGAWYQGASVRAERWVKVENPPVPVKQILNPYAFTNYREGAAPQTASSETVSPALQQNEPVRPSRTPDNSLMSF